MEVAILATALLATLLVVLVIGSMRRRDLGQAIGALSKETVRRDRSAHPTPIAPELPPAGSDVERAAALERHRTHALPLERRAPATVAPFVAPDPEVVGISRRQFFNRSIVSLMVLSLSGFGAATLAFLWTRPSRGFGSKVAVGSVDSVLGAIDGARGFYYRPDARMWMTRYPTGAIEKARVAYSDAELVAMEAGFVAMYQKCPHLGCRVPECISSQWFECPCHGSQYNRVGEKRGGPAPRGMDRFGVSIDEGVVTVDTATIIAGPPVGTNTTGQEAEGPHCVVPGGE